MRDLLKPYSLLLYLLVIIVFFFLGVIYAGIIDAGKNQGLAGGAIVLGYGVISSFFALLASLFAASRLSRNIIVNINKTLGIILVIFLAYFTWNYYTKVKPRREKQQQTTPTVPNQMILKGETAGISPTTKSPFQLKNHMGLGMFAPKRFDNKTLFFYGDINLEKSALEHFPLDSSSFKPSQYGGVEIATAPPYLVPQHLKLDYDLLYFKVISVTEDFLEVEVNKINERTAYVKKKSGKFMYWPEFLLSVNSVELLNEKTQQIHIKPLDHAGLVNQPYSFMKPIKIRQNWMNVLLLTDDFEVNGKAWIKWKENGKLLIKYSLLS